MAQLNPRLLKEAAAERLEQAAYNPKKLVLIHTGIFIGLNLAVNLLNLVLNNQIGTTGGLSGMGLRSILQTAQTLLSYFATLFSPFWAAGFLFAAISIFRGNDVGPRSFLRGFTRFGRILSFTIWQVLLLVSSCVILMYVISFLYLLTPLSKEATDLINQAIAENGQALSGGTLDLSLFPMEAITVAMLPMLIIYGIAALALTTFISYQLRIGPFLLVEGISRGALGAVLVSSGLMRGHKWQMFKLDLSFWWYHGLELLFTIVLYLDLLLPMFGVALPFDQTIMYFICLAAYGILEICLHYWKKADVEVVYAAAYEAIYQEALPKQPPV